MGNELTTLYLALLDFVDPLRRRLSQSDALEYLLYRYGWDAELDDAAFARLRQAMTVVAPIEQFAQTAEPLREKLAAGPDGGLDASDVEALAGSAAVLIRALADFGTPGVAGLADPLDRPELWESIAEQVFDDLLEQYLRVHQPVIFALLRLWRVVRYEPTDAAGPGRVPHTRVWFDWDQATTALTDPLRALELGYHWGDATQPFDHEGALAALGAALTALRVPAARFSPALVTAPVPGDASRSAPADVLALRVTLLERDFPGEQAFYRLGLEAYPAARATDEGPAGLLLKPILEGGAGVTLPLSRLLSFGMATTISAGDAVGLALFPGEAALVGGQGAAGASLTLQTIQTGPWYAVGNAQSSHIELSGLLLRTSVEGTVDDPELRLEARFAGPAGAGGAAGPPGARAVVNLAGADRFVQETVDGGALTFSFAPDIVWSSRTGLTFGGTTAPSLTLPLAVPLGPVTLTDATIALGAAPPAATAAGAIALRVGVGVRGALGPVRFAIAQLGFECVITPYSRDDVRALPAGAAAPTLGALDVDLRFAPPTGVGLTIDAGVVTGGGFLEHTADEYAGALDLSIHGIAVKAYGLIRTTLPGGAPGYSLVGLVSAEFAPAVQLPLGFSLEGVGGLLGIHRTIDEDAVAAALWAGHLDGILFPADPVAAAPQLLPALDTYFPAAAGRYVVGPLAKIGWSADIVVGRVALLLELPEPLQVLLIGEIAVGVPAAKPVLVLHVSFDGGIDFGRKRAFFDAVLHDSRLESYPITGGLAFRYGWGEDPVLALALGGFNPHFQPPASFPVLPRLGISIGSSVAKIEAQAYLAVTSNTLQFGARVELTAGTGGFNVHGWLGFDALCERDPLSFAFDLSAGVDLRHGTDVLASVHLEGTLSGPTPWHIAGEASLSLLFFDVSVHFDRTWGEDAAAPAAPDPLGALVAAFADRSAWSPQPATGVRAAITAVAAPADAGDALLLDPAGALRIAQRAVPLDQPITRFGGVSLGRTASFSVDALAVSGRSIAPSAPASEEFAPAQFLDLSDAEKLSLPSFGRFDAGVTVGGDAVDLGQGERARAVLTPIAYDTTILDSQAPPRPGAEHRPTLGAVLALDGSAHRAAPGLGRYAPAPGTPPRVTLTPDRWVVAGSADLGVRTDLRSDGSKLGALLALRDHLADNPGEAGALQVTLAEAA